MKRPSGLLLGAVAVLVIAIVALASTLVVPSGTWQGTGNLSVARVSASAAVLQNGQILFTGGDPGSGPVASADLFNVDGSISAAPAMLTPRSKHVSVTLQDGRVLVAGGVTTGGSATNAAEIFDPVANSWSSVSIGMTEARFGAAAALLQDGRVVVAGGQNGTTISSTVEIFDPVAGTFSVVGMMSSPRTQHAVTMLQDGRVFIVGGNNGTVPVASTDIFDPVAGMVSAGPALNTARFGHSVTTLLNGPVVVIGGNNGNANPAQMDVTPAELVDFTAATPAFTTLPASLVTPREGHLAVRLPNNNSILIAGGTSAGTTIAAAELFTPQESSQGTWTYSFTSTGTMTAARSAGSANQVNTTSTTMQRNGIVAVAGGTDANGNALSSTEAYGYPTVQTDQSDYSPGSTVTITGSGFQPNETITIQLVESPLIDTHGPYAVTADANGNFVDTSFATDLHDVGVMFTLTASGTTSGLTAQTQFADSFSVACSPNPVTVGSPTTCTATETGNSENGSTITWSVQSGGAGTFSPTTCSIPSGSAQSCSVTYTPTSAPTGSQAILGTSSKNSATGSTILTVNRLTPTVHITSESPTSSVTGQSVTANFSVTGTSGHPNPTGNVTITITNSTATCTGTLTPGNPSTGSCSLAPTAAGSQTLTATYNSDGVYNTATGTTSYTVAKDGTTTTITSNTPNPGTVGQPINVVFTVTANSPGAGAPTGNVTVSDGTGDSCTATVATGTCSLTPASTGTKTLTANYAGDSNFLTSTSSGVSETVNARATATTVTLNPASVVVGQASTITVTVTDGGTGTQSNPAGTIALSSPDANDTFTMCTLAPSGGNAATCTATVTPKDTGTSPRNITATYTPTDSVHAGSNGAAALTVAGRTTSTTVSLSPSSVSVGQASTITVTVTDTSASGTQSNPGGTIAFSSTDTKDNLVYSTCTLASSGANAAKCTAAVTPGLDVTSPESITATYTPNDNVHTTSSGASPLTVTGRGTSTSVTLTPSSVLVGQASTVTVTVTDNTSGTAANPAGTVSFSSPDAKDTFSGTPCTLVANSGSNPPTSSCTTTVTVTSGDVGTSPRNITGTYNPNDNVHTASNGSAALTVSPRTTSTSITLNPTSVLVGQGSTITVTVTDMSATGTASNPGGSITFSSTDAKDNLAYTTCTLSPSGGNASTCTATVTPGADITASENITATYTPSDNIHSGSNGTTSTPLSVSARTTSTTVSLNPSSVGVGQASTVTVTVTDTSASGTQSNPGGTIALSSPDANDTFMTCTLANSGSNAATCTATVTPHDLGTTPRNITATYTSTDNVHSGSSGSASLTVTEPDLTATKSDSVSGSTALGTTWTWSIVVANIGTGSAVFPGSSAMLNDNLPATNITYGAVSVVNVSGTIVNPNHIACSIATNTLSCVAAGQPVTMPSGTSFTVQFTATPAAVGTFVNPTGGTCLVNPNNAVSESNTGNNACSDTVTVTAANTSTTITSPANNSSGIAGQPVTVNFTVTNTSGSAVAPTGTVTVRDGTGDSCQGALTPGAGGVSTGTCNLTPTTTGSKTLVASYPAGTSFNASSSSGTTYTVNVRSTSTTVALGTNPDLAGQATTVTVTVTDTAGTGVSNPGGTVTFTPTGHGSFSGTCMLAQGANPPGTVSCQVSYTPSDNTTPQNIAATYTANDSIHSGNSGNSNLNVTARSTSVTVTFGTNPDVVGQATTVIVTVIDTAGAGAPNPAGTVSFTPTGHGSFSGTCTLAPTGTTGTVNCQVNYTPSDTATPQNVAATYASNDSIHSGNSSNADLNVIGTPPSITSNTGTTFTAGMAGMFTATTSGTPPPALSYTGSLPSGVSFTDNHNGTATLGGTTTTAGNFPIVITAQNGVNPNATQNFTLMVNPAALSSITLSPASAAITAGGTQAYTATGYDQYGNSRGDVTGATTFTVTAGVCTVNSCSSTVAGAQTVTGNDGGIKGMATLNVMPGAITYLVLNPANASITAGGSQAYTAQGYDMYTNLVGDVTASTAFAIGPNGSCTGATCTASVADANGSSHTVTGTYTNNAQGMTSLTVTAGTFSQLQLLAPGETAAPGTVPGKTGTPSTEYVNGSFKVIVNAVDQYWNVVNTVTDTVGITSNDAKAVLPSNAALVAGTGTFSVTLETVSYNPAVTTLTASDYSDNTKTSDTSPAIAAIVVYTAGISPADWTTGQQASYTLMVNNAPAPNANNLASIEVAVPPADQGTIGNVTVTATQKGGTAVNWTYDPSMLPGIMRFFGNTNNDAIAPGGTITIAFTASSNATVTNTPVTEVWNTTAFSDATSTAPLPLAPPEPTVQIGAAPQITSANSTNGFTYGTAGTIFTVTTTGVPTPSLSVSGSFPSWATFKDNGDGTATISGTPIAAVSSVFTITAHNGYGNDATQMFTLTVNKANATASVTAGDKTYDSTTAATITACTLSGLIGSDSVTCTAAGPNTFASANVGTWTVTATNISLGGPAANNYQLSTNTATTTASINTMPITATLNAANRKYDGTATEPDANVSCSLNGVLQADTNNVTCTATKGTFNSSQVAVANQVTATVTISGSAAGNYTLGAPGTTLSSTLAMTSANIIAVPLTITASSGIMTYGGTPVIVSAMFSGFVTGENAANLTTQPLCGPAFTSSTPANSYVSSCSGAIDTNYTIGYVTGMVIVNQAAPAFSNLSQLQPIPYGTASITLSGTISANCGMSCTVYPPTTEYVQITINGVTVNVAIGANGAFSTTFDTHAIMASNTAYTITYGYTGDANFKAAPSDTSTTLTVQPANTQTTVTSSDLSNAVVGEPVTFTVNVTDASSGSTGTPTGKVTISDGNTLIGVVTLNSGSATFTTALLSSTGSAHTINAHYKGDPDFNPSHAAAISQVINTRGTGVTLAFNPAQGTFAAPDTITATVAEKSGLPGPSGSPDSFAASGTLVTARQGATATQLLNGLILVAGGQDVLNNIVGSAELYNPATGTSALSGGSLGTPRYGAAAALLPNGCVLIAGGTGSGGVLTAAEIYDPATDSFTSTGSLNTARTWATATPLSNGTVAVIGGSSDGSTALNTVEVFSSGTFTALSIGTGLATPRFGHVAALLANGTILVAGGNDGTNVLNSAERYDPASNTSVSLAATLSTERQYAGAVFMPNGYILVAGGDGSTPLGSADLYDPETQKFYASNSTVGTARTKLAAVQLTDGHVLVVGGWGPANSPATLASVEVYTPAFTAQGALSFVSDNGNDTFSGTCQLQPAPPATNPAQSNCTETIVPGSAGARNITGNYSADAVHSSSSSGATSFTVDPATTSTSVASSLNPSTYGQSVTFTATVSNTSAGSSGTPTGSVQFYIDGVAFGSPVTLSGSGTSATATSGSTATLTVNGGTPHTVTATYTNSDGNFLVSDNSLSPLLQTVNKGTPTFSSLTASQIIPYGTTSITVSGKLMAPTATPPNVDSVTVSINGTTVTATVSLSSGTFTATLNTSAIPATATAYTITYSFAGDTNFNAANDASTSLTVNKATPKFSNLIGQTIVYGVNSVTLSGTLSANCGASCTVYPPSGESVSVSAGGVMGLLTIGGNGMFSGTLTGTGALIVSGLPYTIQYTYAGDNNFNNANDSSTKLTVNTAPLTITASSGMYTYGGTPFVVTPQYSGFVNNEGPGNLSTQPTCGPIFNTTSTNVGTYSSSCWGAVDSNYAFTYIGGSVMVTRASTTTAVVSSVSPSTFMQLVTFTATVSPQYSGTPTGSVTFSDNYNNSNSVLCASVGFAVVNGQNVATCSTASLQDTYPNQITATYSGDPTGTGDGFGNFAGSNSSVTQNVNPAPNVSLSPMFLSFGNQNVNTTSSGAKVTLKNIGDALLNIPNGGITISGNNASEFAETNNCGSAVAAGGSCTITVTFTPVDTGVATAGLQITDNDDDTPGAQQTVSITGAGLSTIAGGSLYTDAVFATASSCGALTLSGGSSVDSFNSGIGFAASHQNNGGNVGTNGNITLNGSKSGIYGTAAVDSTTTGSCNKTSITGLTTSGGAQVTGSLIPLNGPITYAPPPAPSPAPPTTNQNIAGSCPSGMTGCTNAGNKTVSLAPGTYGNINVSGGTTVQVSTGTYNVNSLSLSGNSALKVISGTVVFNIAGASLSGSNAVMDLSGGSIEDPYSPASLQFNYGGSRAINLSGGSGSYATVYAPNAIVNLSGGTDFFGSIIGSTVTSSGGTAIHYDTSLPNIPGGDYIWFSAVANNVQGLPSSGQVKLYLTNASISFASTSSQCPAGGTFNPNLGTCSVPVPNAVVTFNSQSQGSGAKTSFDLINGRWSTSVAKSGLTGNTFVTGLAIPVPTGGFPNGIQNVQFSAAFSTDTPGISLQWQWGAAIYSSFSTTYATGANSNALGVNAEDGSQDANGTDPAGTPETYKTSLTFGGTGGGLTNYTGFWSIGAGIIPTIAPMSVSPSSLDFGAQSQGATSAVMMAVFTNNDSATHNFTGSGIQIMGTDGGDFALLPHGASNTPGNCLSVSSLASGASCTLYLTFKPIDAGTRTAKVVINDDANNSPQSVYLTGTGQ